MKKKNSKSQTHSVFDYSHPMPYVEDMIRHGGYGFKAKMAKVMQCQAAYVSRVLSGEASLSLEQAERLSVLFGHTSIEAEYFITLSLKDRAGTPDLRKHFEKLLSQIRARHLDIKGRVFAVTEISEKDHQIYYSSWMYIAVYVLVSIPEFQAPEAIADRLQISKAQVIEILEFLLSTGAVKRQGQRYTTSNVNFHLKKDSPLIAKHHLNWRLKAMTAIEAKKLDNLHYSVTMSLSKKDAEVIQGKLVDLIGEITELLVPSSEETAKVLTLDFFDL